MHHLSELGIESQKYCYIYVRVSTPEQHDDDSVSIPMQLAECQKFCEDKGYIVLTIYQDVGSGFSKHRPDLVRMLRDTQEDQVSFIVVWRSDRLMRGMYSTAAVMEALENTTIEIESVTDTVDLETAGLMGWLAGREINALRDRVSMGKRGRALAGKIPAKAIGYGHRVDDEGYAYIDDGEARIVRYMYQLCIEENLGARQIANRLNLEEIASPSGVRRTWDQGSVQRILRSETYKGDYFYNKRISNVSAGSNLPRIKPREKWIPIKVPPIVNKEIWDKAQACIDSRRIKSARNTKAFYLLQHLVYCEGCKRLMGGVTRNRRKVGSYVYEFEVPERHYLCNGARTHRTNCRSPQRIPAEALEDFVWKQARRIILSPGIVISGLESQGLTVDGRAELDRQIAKADRDMKKAREERAEIISWGAKKLITEEEVGETLPPIRERISYYEEILRDLKDRKEIGHLYEEQKKYIMDWCSAIASALDELNDDDRKTILGQLFQLITIDADNRLAFTVAFPGSPPLSYEPLVPNVPSGPPSKTFSPIDLQAPSPAVR